MALATYTVTGDLPVRDAVTKLSVYKGGTVTLDDAPVPRGPDEAGRPVKPLAATNIRTLIEQGIVAPVVTKAKKD